MHLTDYHAKYFAHELTKRCPTDSAERLAGVLVDAQDEIERRRDQLISDIESRLAQHLTLQQLFTIRWGLV